MSLYLLLNRINVQNANAIAGLTWGFPAITHFSGFTHNLTRKLSASIFSDLTLRGCGVVSHVHHVHTFGQYNDRFLQSKNPGNKGETPPIIEEGKMNITVSLITSVEGHPGRRADEWLAWLEQQCLRQRLAGGTILSVANIALFDGDDRNDFYRLKRQLLPGFALMDRSTLLAEHYQTCQQKDENTELVDAWLDFAAFRQQARPAFDKISSSLKLLGKTSSAFKELYDLWQKHLSIPYEGQLPVNLVEGFSRLPDDASLSVSDKKALLQQWESYLYPNAKTPSDWETLPKPESGYLVPIMIGYKAISPVYENHEIANTRDHETPVCFVESVHSVGEWLGVNRFREIADIYSSLWHHEYEDGWYLCEQKPIQTSDKPVSNLDEQMLAMFTNPEDES